MKDDERIDICIQRDYLVVKSNKLIQNTRFELSLTEQKAIAFICSMIKPPTPMECATEQMKLNYEFDIRNYCKVCGIDYKGGKNYRDIKETIKKLADCSMWFHDEFGETEILMRWLAYVKINKKSEKVEIELDRNIAPYLLNLKEKFTQYQLFYILTMKSAFSIRLYEIMKSFEFKGIGSKTYEINELKNILKIEDKQSYQRYPDLRRFVLDKAVNEINEQTDIIVRYEPIKKGRKVIKILFNVRLKVLEERSKINDKIYRNLDGY